MKITVRNISGQKRVFGFDRKQVFEVGAGITARVEPNELSTVNIDRFVQDGLIEIVQDPSESKELTPVIEERKSHDPIGDLKSPDKKPPADLVPPAENGTGGLGSEASSEPVVTPVEPARVPEPLYELGARPASAKVVATEQVTAQVEPSVDNPAGAADTAA